MPEDNITYVQVPLSDYNKLLDAQEKLSKLEQATGTSWSDGYDAGMTAAADAAAIDGEG